MNPPDPRALREEALHKVEASLVDDPDSVPHLFTWAWMLDTLGKDNAALQAYIDLLQRDGTHREGLTALATLLKKLGQREPAARADDAEARRRYPPRRFRRPRELRNHVGRVRQPGGRAHGTSRTPCVSIRPMPMRIEGSPSCCCG